MALILLGEHASPPNRLILFVFFVFSVVQLLVPGSSSPLKLARESAFALRRFPPARA
jgi:hypothetical protein